jgi:hypothetical protein
MDEILRAVILALSANTCPVCGMFHRQRSHALDTCAAKAVTAGYLGYDYDRETWVRVPPDRRARPDTQY